MLFFETSAMGWKFMLTRFIIDIPGIALIAYITQKVLHEKEINFYLKRLRTKYRNKLNLKR